MKTLNFQTEIGPDGKLRVELPVDFPPGPVEGVVIVQSTGPKSPPPFDVLKGALTGKLSPDIDIDATLNEMNQDWERSIDLPDGTDTPL